MRKIVVFTPDVVGARMAGPGIRAYHFARELATTLPTALVAKFESPDILDLADVQTAEAGSSESTSLLRDAALVIGQPHRETLAVARSGVPVMFDLFDPVILELAEMRSGLRGLAHRAVESRRLRRAIQAGGPLIVATPAQRDLYGKFGAAPDRFVEIPFGIPVEDAPGLEKENPPLVLWNGGIWPWLDPDTAIRAIAEVNRLGTEATLAFMGTGRPNAAVATALPRLESEAHPHVRWNPDWVPYGERAQIVARATVSMVLHRDTEEAKYSIRTRLFDSIWCGVPIVATHGGFAADLVEREQLGIVVPPEDVGRVAEAIRRIIEDDGFRARCVSAQMGVRERFRWSEVCKPLLREAGRILATSGRS